MATAPVLSHRTAADLWRIALSESEIVDVTIESTAGRKRRRGIRLRRGPLPQNEVTRRSGFPVTTIARTLLDLAAVVSRRVLERAIDEAQYLGLFDAEALNDALHANGARPGCGKLRSVLPDHCPGSTRTRSPLEERFLAFCRRHRLPPPELGVPIGPYEADFLWREQRLIVETDGRDGHDTAKAFEHDRARDAYLAVKGFRVVRYTDRRLKREAATVVAELRALLVA